MIDMISGKPNGSKIAITSAGPTLDSPVDGRFGRCEYFVICDDNGDGVIAVANSARSLGGGAGIQAAQQLVDLDVVAVLTGDVGPNAFRVLSAAGVKVYVGCTGHCADALQQYRAGKLSEAGGPTSPGHHGHGAGQRRGWM